MRSRLVIPLIAVLAAAGLVACKEEPAPVDVAVIVLDDFSPDVTPAAHDPGANCANTGRGANEIETSGGGGGLPEGVSHGEAVYQTLSRSLQDTGFTSPTPLDIRREPLVADHLTEWKHPDLGKSLLLLGMDTADFDTGRIATDLQSTLEYVRTAFGVDHFVLNMSFIITPCDVPGWLAGRGKPMSNAELLTTYRRLVDRNPSAVRLRDAIRALEAGPAGALPAALLASKALREITQRVAVNTLYGLWISRDVKQLMQQQDLAAQAYRRVTTEDPLHKYLATNPFGGVASVGAAGNGVYNPAGELVRIDFPFAPAIWNTVVSASAMREGQRATYSNSGEVMLDGLATLEGVPAAREVYGTSFAAPRLSARQALHLMRGHPTTCAPDGRTRHLPPLGYTDITVETATPQWRNLLLGAAAAEYCPEFPTA